MTVLEQMLEQTGSVVILGHVRPDGDCLGSTLGLYHYIQTNYPAIRAAVYLEESSPKFGYLAGYDAILHETDEERYELCICLTVEMKNGWDPFGVFSLPIASKESVSGSPYYHTASAR